MAGQNHPMAIRPMYSNRTMRVFSCACLTTLLLLSSCNKSVQQPDPVANNHNKNAAADENAGSKTEAGNEKPAKDVADFPPNVRITIPGSLVEFELVLVAGNQDQQIAPFYIGKYEVTWDEFAYWALCRDIKDKKAILQREKKLRPSAPHDSESIYRGWGRERQPAVGISRLAAERYCDWLSQETGKKFRLPTIGEWAHAYQFDNGKPESEEETQKKSPEKIAWFVGNSLDEETFDNRAMPVGKLQPNQLGIYDMLGNASEWVVGTDDKKVAVGGNFLTPESELKPGHQVVEDQSVWNKNYPNSPKSIWWYVDADFVGFRLVMDPS